MDRLRHMDLDNWVHYDAREFAVDGDGELLFGELPWSRGYAARAVAEARLNDPRARAPWEFAASRISPPDESLERMIEAIKQFEQDLQVEYDAMHNTYSVVRRSDRKQNQSLDTAKLDEFLDEM